MKLKRAKCAFCSKKLRAHNVRGVCAACQTPKKTRFCVECHRKKHKTNPKKTCYLCTNYERRVA